MSVRIHKKIKIHAFVLIYLELELEIFIFHRKWLKIYIIEKLLSLESDFCKKSSIIRIDSKSMAWDSSVVFSE